MVRADTHDAGIAIVVSHDMRTGKRLQAHILLYVFKYISYLSKFVSYSSIPLYSVYSSTRIIIVR